MGLYLAINLLTLAVPLAFSFESRIRWSRDFGPLLAAIATVALPFLVWDAWFAARGIWGFNPAYLLGPAIAGLPLEEILFFACIPFASLFIVRNVEIRVPTGWGRGPARVAAGLGALAAALVALRFGDRPYTAMTFGLLAPSLALAAWRAPGWLGTFAVGWLIVLLPFLLVNGLLTAGLHAIDAGPIVWYDDTYNLGLRLGTIPVEDAFYGLLLLGWSWALYARWRAPREPATGR